ncbi:MAG: FtsX-like permease family protein [Caldilineaceae bacterium]|nr:FtsX-like permease family protein [Caldilineaceae bacterium]
MRVYAVPPDTVLLEPEIQAGRWLREGDENAIVISGGLLFDEPDLGVGETMTLRINDEESDWEIVGINRVFQPAIAPAVVYVNQEYYWRLLGGYDHTDTIRVLTTRHDPATHAAVVQALEERLGAGDIEVVSTRNATEERTIFTERFNILTVILMLMAFLLATVGSLGLLGAMSINVLERKREIGVMRAIGASNQVILRIFIVEGMLIGLLSWMGGVLFSQFMARLISHQVGLTFARLPLTFVYDLRAPLIWLMVVLVIAALSSLAPARNAVNVSVRETLEYE